MNLSMNGPNQPTRTAISDTPPAPFCQPVLSLVLPPEYFLRQIQEHVWRNTMASSTSDKQPREGKAAPQQDIKLHKHVTVKPHKCSYCEKTFARKWLLKRHERTHTGEKPFTCDICSRAFAGQSNWRAHTQIHEESRKFKCKLCQKSFSRRSLLSKRMQNHSQ